jgi:chloramphenicol O-acetyltransferase
MLPYNAQVNHLFVDGVHLGRFEENLEREIAEL